VHTVSQNAAVQQKTSRFPCRPPSLDASRGLLEPRWCSS
jgi:hypothetical protein